MKITILRLCLAAVVAVSSGTDGNVVDQNKPTIVLRPSGANFRQSLGEIIFSPNGKLYLAFRVPSKDKTSSTLRVTVFDPTTGKLANSFDYSLPAVNLPRVATDFKLSRDGSILAYAELHDPQVVATIDASTLKLLSISVANIFGEQDFAPDLAAVTSQSVILSAGKLTRDGKTIAVHEVRKLTLNVIDLHQVISEKTVATDTDPEGRQY